MQVRKKKMRNGEICKSALKNGSDLLVSGKHKVYARRNGKLIVSLVMMSEIFKDNSISSHLKSEDKTTNMNSFEMTQIPLEIFEMFNPNFIQGRELQYLPSKGLTQNRILFTELSDSSFNFRSINVHNESHHFLNSSGVIDLPLDGSLDILLNLSINSFFIGSSSTGCQSIDSQNCSSSFESFLDLIYLSNISFFMVSSLPTSDQFIQGKAANLSLKDLSTGTVTHAIYISPLACNFSNASSFFLMPCLITSGQFMCGIASSLFFNSSGIDNVNLSIFSTSCNCIDTCKCMDIYKPSDSREEPEFSLMPITDVYEDINNGKEIYFLDYRNESVKVLSITKKPYSGKIYDVENDVVLVRRVKQYKNKPSEDFLFNYFASLNCKNSSNNFSSTSPSTRIIINKDANCTTNFSVSSNKRGFFSCNPSSITFLRSLFKSLPVEAINNPISPIVNGEKNDDYKKLSQISNRDYEELIIDDDCTELMAGAVRSGNSNNGSFYGDSTINLSGGRYSGGLQLDGSGDYVEINDSSSLRPTSLTEVAWVKYFSIPTTFNNIITKNYGTGIQESYSIFWYPCSFGGCVSAFYGLVYDSYTNCYSLTPTLNQWYFVAHTFNNQTKNSSLYIDGNLVDSKIYNTSIPHDTKPLTIGAEYESGVISYLFNGTIDEVMIWNRSLSASEIQQLYFTNLYKYNETEWYLYVNQSKNSTTGLDIAPYTYSASAKDAAGNENLTETRTIKIMTAPSANRFRITDSSGANIASIDNQGNIYLKGTASQSQSSLNPTPYSFIVQNSSMNVIAYINSTGYLFLKGTITENSDLTGMTNTNLEFRNSSDNIIAFFDNGGNLKLKGKLGENYANP